MLSAIRAIYSLFVGLFLPLAAEYPNIFSNVSTFPRVQDTSGIPDGCVHFLVCGLEMFCDRRIQKFGNAAYHFHIFS